MQIDNSSRFTSERLNANAAYTTAELRQLFELSDHIGEATLFRPGGYNSVWLFVTEQSAPEMVPYCHLADENTLLWQGHLSGRTDQLIISHEQRGLELLVFYRTSQAQYPGTGFRYMGRFEYQSHEGTPPTMFLLTRAGWAPSIAEVEAKLQATDAFDPANVREGREWVLASIVRRRGQAAFRAGLLQAYAGKCAITGCSVEPLLEAAHIIPYLGMQTHHIQNGLLLRADIHTLFDLHLLTISPESYTVLLSPALLMSEYGILDKQALYLPKDSASCPSPAALRAHQARCAF